jgi:hypothetical protein
MIGICELCKKETTLVLSHYIPSFIGKWFKDTSITGYLRVSSNMSLRQQDLLKEHLLCIECEKLFSGWEKQFAEYVFLPYIENRSNFIEYQKWLIYFCTSLTWRSLVCVRKHNCEQKHEDDYLLSVNHAKIIMEDFLLGKSNSLHDCDQHLFPLDEIKSTTMSNLPSNINRYMLRSFGMDIIGNRNNLYVYTKIPYFILLGIIKTKESKQLSSSRIKMNKGILSPRKYIMPKGIHSYIIEKSKQMEELDDKIPEHQQDKITYFLRNNPKKATNSKTIEAFLADYRLFGDKAFKKKQ